MMYNMKKKLKKNMPKSFGCRSFFPLCRSLAWAAFPVSSSCMRTAKSLSLSGLSSAELAPLAIPSERGTLQSGAPNSSRCFKVQCTMGQHVRTCVSCARSCAMHVQTDTHIYTNITESQIDCNHWPCYTRHSVTTEKCDWPSQGL